MMIKNKGTKMRTKVTEEYLYNMTQMLCKLYPNIDKSKITNFIKQIVIEKITRPKVTYIQYPSYGNSKVVTSDLLDLIHKHASNIITPNGCIYLSQDKKISTISKMIDAKLSERKAVKKKMLKAAAEGNSVLADSYNYLQATIKINLNSLPGGYGSAYNLFYDKGNYNAITATARAFIAQAYTNTEELLGGNFVWFDEEELINHIIIHTRTMPPTEQINHCVNKYKLKTPSVDELFGFYLNTIHRYDNRTKLSIVKSILQNLSQEEITYLYYFNNLRHLIIGNSEIFLPIIKNMFKPESVDVFKTNHSELNVTKDTIYDLDGDLVIVLSVAFNKWLEGNQIYDLPQKDPELAIKLGWAGKHLEEQLNYFNDMMKTFVFNPCVVQRGNIRKHMLRNTVVISDTDSVIYTAKDWSLWYTENGLHASIESDQIGGLITFWLTKAIAEVLHKSSVAQGAVGKYAFDIQMKNEFTYPTLILFDLKKTYAGIKSIQEGVVFSKPKTDIKGGNLRSSDICKATTDFNKDLIVNKILIPAMHGPLSATELINTVVKFEQTIKQKLKAGDPEYLKVVSIKYEREYAIPLSSNYFYYMGWRDIFEEKYGEIRVPTKVNIVPIISPTISYWEWLENKDPDIYKKMVEFKNKYKKLPSAFAINPLNNKIPEELIPIIDIRGIIYHNVRATYRTLDRLKIGIGNENKKMLLSDMYINEQ